jgi:hypothetical protein
MDSIKRFNQRLFKDKGTIFGPEAYNQYADPDYSVTQFPFEFTADVIKGLWNLTKRKPKPKLTKLKSCPAPIPIPQPTREELIEAANQEYERNCALIDVSHLPCEDKVALKDKEREVLNITIQTIFD